MSRFYTPAFIPGTVPAALEAYDLPDLAASLAPRKLMMAGVTDGAANNSDPGNIKEDLQVISDAYHSRKADSQLNIIAGRYTGALDELYKDWIK